MKDVGKPKAEVAAARIMERVAGVQVTPHFGRIEDKPHSWYADFHVIALGLDSVEARWTQPQARPLTQSQARSYINSVACGFLGAAGLRLRRPFPLRRVSHRVRRRRSAG